PIFEDMGRDPSHRFAPGQDGREAAIAAQRERIFARYQGGKLDPVLALILRDSHLRSDFIELARPIVRREEFKVNPNNLLDLYNWKAMLLQSIAKPSDASTMRNKALNYKNDGMKAKNDVSFDEKKFT